MFQFQGIDEFIPCFFVILLSQTAFALFYYFSDSGQVSDRDRKVQLFVRFYIGLMLSSALSMYWIISKYGIVFVNEHQAELKEEVESESELSDGEESEPEYDDLKCGICLRGYSSNLKKRVPRMMRCGHTVCYGCAKRLREYSAIICPFCQKYTFENNKDLPKNYSMIGLLDQMKLLKRNKGDVSEFEISSL
uniref:RING-type domain-containing protein n=1 Tax=Caenorhabditis tropicalis TaxID=1561998 RepID=A0A1I7T2N2_9PELO